MVADFVAAGSNLVLHPATRRWRPSSCPACRREGASRGRHPGAARVWEMVAKGVLKVSIGQTYALTDAAQAHIDLEARKTVGSTLLLP